MNISWGKPFNGGKSSLEYKITITHEDLEVSNKTGETFYIYKAKEVGLYQISVETKNSYGLTSMTSLSYTVENDRIYIPLTITHKDDTLKWDGSYSTYTVEYSIDQRVSWEKYIETSENTCKFKPKYCYNYYIRIKHDDFYSNYNDMIEGVIPSIIHSDIIALKVKKPKVLQNGSYFTIKWNSLKLCSETAKSFLFYTNNTEFNEVKDAISPHNFYFDYLQKYKFKILYTDKLNNNFTSDITEWVYPLAINPLSYQNLNLNIGDDYPNMKNSLSKSSTKIKYSISPELPDSLVLDESTGEISGKCTKMSDNENYIVNQKLVIDESINVSSYFSLKISYKLPTMTYNDAFAYKGETISIIPSGPNLEWNSVEINPELPKELFLNTTGEIHGSTKSLKAGIYK